MAYEGNLVAEEQNAIIEQFFAGADFLIHDAQYTEEEYRTKVGWGHSCIEWAVSSARRAGVKKLALFHHDPDRTDVQLDYLTEKYCQPGDNGGMEVFFAREGSEIDLLADD